jgi:hypothetical protein
MRNLGVLFTEIAWLEDLAADCAETVSGTFSTPPRRSRSRQQPARR